MRFSKWHALGNSYLVVEQPDAGPIEPARAERLCDPRRGIGSDGVLEVVGRSIDRIDVVIWNPDGSIAEMSGNGVRIAGCWLAAETGATEITVTTSGREIQVSLDGEGRARADHGPVEVGDSESLDVSGEIVELVAVSVGNPHAVVRMTHADPRRPAPAGAAPRDALPLPGPDERAARSCRWSSTTWTCSSGNAEPARRQSSGSSSIAAAAAAIAHGWCSSPVTVHLPGGELTVEVENGRAWLDGTGCRDLPRHHRSLTSNGRSAHQSVARPPPWVVASGIPMFELPTRRLNTSHPRRSVDIADTAVSPRIARFFATNAYASRRLRFGAAWWP